MTEVFQKLLLVLVVIPLSLGACVSLDGGECVEGDCKKGQGTMRHPNGYIYVGEWKDGKQHGQGTITLDDGTIFVGEWVEGVRHGQGTMTSDGIKFAGEYSYDTPVRGTLTLDDGTIFVGEWDHHAEYGQGKIKYPDGAEYEGEWKGDFPHGHGTMTYPDGRKQEGLWDMGKFDVRLKEHDKRIVFWGIYRIYIFYFLSFLLIFNWPLYIRRSRK
jgi:hypothetical protein